MLKKNYTETFLQEYKRLEQSLQIVYGPDMSVRAYEDENQEESKKLQICRLLRNYAAHNNDINEFCPIPQELCLYLSKITDKVMANVKTVKDEMIRTKPLTEDDQLCYAARRLNTVPVLPVVDKNLIIIGGFTQETLRKAVENKTNWDTPLKDINAQLEAVKSQQIIAQNLPLIEAEKSLKEYQVLFVVSEKTNKYIGLITPKE